MNYLAHLFLSGDNPKHMVGNFMGDSVKGRDYENYDDELRLGILLHRQIDHFMDTHPEVEKGKARLRNHIGKFSGVVMDVFYDHFLALNWHEYSAVNRDDFIQSSYRILEKHVDDMPQITQFIMGRMISNNWLGHYHKEEGIDRALTGLSHRTRYKNNMADSVQFLVKFKQDFDQEFRSYFPEIIDHCNTFIRQNG